ncbi:MAG: hypothetical protein C0502_01875 [Opitutus sp.]|nr:hypothetical protein [Opitutus sp.]
MKPRTLLRLPPLLAAPLLLAGCVTEPVRPWQRATLTDYTMRPDRDPLQTAMSEHVFYSREGSIGGRGVGGSGCGCN